jgi:hypothetical protein
MQVNFSNTQCPTYGNVYCWITNPHTHFLNAVEDQIHITSHEEALDIVIHVGRLVVVIDVNRSHGFWTARLIKVFGHEGQCTCI